MGISGRVIIEKRGNGADNTFSSTRLPASPSTRRIGSLACVMPPVGLASIAAVLRKSGHQVYLFDAALQNRVTNQQWAERICSLKPDMIGFSTTTSAFLDAYDVCLKVKEISPDIKTVFGGVHVSWGKEKILESFPAIDYVIAGEGETAIRMLADGSNDCDRIYFRDGQTVRNGTKASLPVFWMSCLFPAYDLLSGFPGKYLMPLFGYPRHPGANIISSRGCVYSCTYCDRSVFGKVSGGTLRNTLSSRYCGFIGTSVSDI